MTRRELDQRLALIEAAVQHLAVQLPLMLREIRSIREGLPPSPPGGGEALPEQPKGGHP